MSRRNDYLSAALWAALGLVIVIASFRIDRLENLNVNPWSVPGLTPGVVGLLMILLALALGLQTRSRKHAGTETVVAVATDDGASGDWRRTVLAGALCVLFAGASLGHGLSFVAEGAAFIFLFSSAFSWSQWRAEGRVARGLMTSLAVSVAASAVISWLFESVFLVRLP